MADLDQEVGILEIWAQFVAWGSSEEEWLKRGQMVDLAPLEAWILGLSCHSHFALDQRIDLQGTSHCEGQDYGCGCEQLWTKLLVAELACANLL